MGKAPFGPLKCAARGPFLHYIVIEPFFGSILVTFGSYIRFLGSGNRLDTFRAIGVQDHVILASRAATEEPEIPYFRISAHLGLPTT